MKKISLLLVMTLFLSLLTPSFATAVDSDTGMGYIVKLREQSANNARLMDDSGLEERSSEAGVYHASSLEEIKNLGDQVEYYEPDCEARLFELPNDTYASRQWSIPKLEIEAAWDKKYDGKNVRVAVIDSGVNSMHEDFADTVFEKGANMIDGSHDVTDQTGHGTTVCGILAATRNNNIGVAGFSDYATIIPIKCFIGKTTQASYIVSAVYEAVDVYEADVINLSLGINRDLRSMREAIDYAVSRGVIVLSAVGNDGIAELNYPAAYNNVVGVGSIDKNSKVSSFSQKNSSVFVTAPGEDIYGLGHKSKNEYISGDGTSFSTPLVAVAAIILKQFAPKSTAKDFMELLKASVTDYGPVGYDQQYGYGGLNIRNFVVAMEEAASGDISQRFPDVAGHWATNEIKFCVNKKLFEGVTDNSFEPETAMTRGMFITVLGRLVGEDLSGYKNTFLDVRPGAYYANACAWGAEKGIIEGLGNGMFNPDGLVSRQEMGTILYRYAKVYSSVGPSNITSLTRFSDGASTAEWAKTPMAWTVESELISGRGNGKLAPKESAKRCEVATIITRFVNKLAA